MKKEILENLVNQGMSTTEIGRQINLSQSCARYWLKKYNLKTCPLHLLENRYKYNNEKILEVWKSSDSINQFLLNLNVGTSGGAWYHYKTRLEKLGIDLSDSTLNGRSRGGQKTAKLKNRENIKKKIRLPRPALKKAMDLENIPYECIDCKISMWRDKKLKLHIHHKDENKRNNHISNLEYLCPNCHGIKHYVED